jgi:methyl-accepting chemotaxis protein
MKKMSLKAKLICTLLGVGLLPLLASSVFTYVKTSTVIKEKAYTAADIIASAKATAVSNYFDKEMTTIKDLATLADTQEALLSFSSQFEKLEKSTAAGKFVNSSAVLTQSSKLKAYYEKEFAKAYVEKSNGQKADIEGIFSRLDTAAIIAQHEFIVENPNPLGSKDILVSPKNKSEYGSLHAKYHTPLREILVRHSLYDLFLVNSAGRIVYSVFKETDFATSLANGPWSSSGLAKAFEGSAKLKAGEVFISDFEVYTPSYEAPASFAASPIYVGEKYIGSIIIQLPLDKITAILASREGLGDSGEALLIGSDGKLRADTFRNKTTHSVAAAFSKDSEISIESEAVKKALKGESGVMQNTSYDGVKTLASYRPIKLANLNWAVVTELPESEILSDLTVMLYVFGGIIIIGSLLIFALAYSFGNLLSNQITAISSLLKDTSHQVSASSTQSAASATELSEASTEQAASLQETMASIEEISAMVAQNAESAGKVLLTVTENKKSSDEGSKRVDEMIHSIDEIKNTNDMILQQMETSNKEFGHIVQIITDIGEKTKVINDIVFQTKLLSFNASVEAARAGEHGKGFAVVAEEVGNLAQMSGNAAKEITDMLTNSVKKVNEIVDTTRTKVDQLVEVGRDKIAMGQSTAQKCREVLLNIAASATSVSVMVNEITHASKEQSQGVQEINKAISQLDQVTQQNSAVAQQSSSQAELLSAQAMDLQKAVGDLVAFVTGQFDEFATKEETQVKKSTVHKIEDHRKSAAPMKKAVGETGQETPKFDEF